MFGIKRQKKTQAVVQTFDPSTVKLFSQDEFLRLLRSDLMIAIWKNKNFTSAELIANEIKAVQNMSKAQYRYYRRQKLNNYLQSIGIAV